MTGDARRSRLFAHLRGMSRGFDRRFAMPIAAAFSGFLGLGALAPVLPTHVRGDLGASDVDLGIVIGVFALAALSTRMLAGRFVDVRGGPAGLQLGLAFCSLAGLVFLVPAGVPGLVLARIIHGVGQAFLFAGCTALTFERAPAGQRAQALGLLGVGTWGGNAVGPVFGAALGSFTATALFVVVLPLPVSVALVRARAKRPRRPAAARASKSRLFPSEALRPGVAQGLISAGSAALAGFLVLRLAETGGGGAIAYGAFAASVLCSRTLLTSLVDEQGPAVGMLIGSAAFASGLVVVALAPVPAIGVAGAALCGLGCGFPWPSIATYTVGRVEEHEKGGAVGALNSCSDAAQFCGAIVAGLTATAFGYSAVFVLAALGVVAAGILIIPPMRASRPRTVPVVDEEVEVAEEVGLAEH